MKRTILTLLFVFSLCAVMAQIDSANIKQRVAIEQKYVLHFLSGVNWDNTEIINLLYDFRPQYDSIGREKSNKIITLEPSSRLLANGMDNLSRGPEGEYTEYNAYMIDKVSRQITNPWLGRRMQEIKQRNFAIRDARILATALRVEQIQTPPK